jgi:hypothetical protein
MAEVIAASAGIKTTSGQAGCALADLGTVAVALEAAGGRARAAQ